MVMAPGKGTVGILAARREQRGAAVFVVTLAIVLLSGLGLWAIQWAASVDQASGYARVSRQTQFVAEVGLVAGTTFLSTPGWGATQYNLAKTRPDPCASTGGITRFCRSIILDDLDKQTQASTSKNLIDPGSSSAVGSLGSKTGDANEVQGRFILEMTDPQPAIVAGSDISKAQYYRVTLTSHAEVLPRIGTGTGLCDTSTNSVSSRTAMRAHTVIGPI
ncbi:MAG TPA: hypothetical protein VLC09_12490 [Polyangiaceae bacterium]|nr:hypothetical protein [Polyangiaceae bacterium]